MPAPRAWWAESADAAANAEEALEEVSSHLDELRELLDECPDTLPFVRGDDDGPWAA